MATDNALVPNTDYPTNFTNSEFIYFFLEERDVGTGS